MWIERDVEGNLITDWYMKPISSGRILNFQSCHHMSQKLGTAVGFTKCVLGLSDPKNRERGIKTVLQIGGIYQRCHWTNKQNYQKRKGISGVGIQEYQLVKKDECAR